MSGIRDRQTLVSTSVTGLDSSLFSNDKWHCCLCSEVQRDHWLHSSPGVVSGWDLWLPLPGEDWQDVLPGWESLLVGVYMVFPGVSCCWLFSLVRYLHWLNVNQIPRFMHWPLWALRPSPAGPKSSSPSSTPSVSHASFLKKVPKLA